MRLEWIDDILAVLDGGSLARAAEKRLLTQSAFTRRVRIIEDSVGATLFDRSRKPVTLISGVEAMEPELRELSIRMHKLRHKLKTASDKTGKSISIVCQHSLTTTVSPQVVRALAPLGRPSVRVRSGNQDECLMDLISKEVDFAIMYALPDDETPDLGSALEAVTLGEDLLVPVATPHMQSIMARADIPVISYPSDVFLGQVFAKRISPRLSKDLVLSTIAEAALTLAILQLVLDDLGIAWLPQSLIGDQLAQGKLVLLDDVLPAQSLNIRLVRLSDGATESAGLAWGHLATHLQLQAG